MTGTERIAAERQRQIEAEGWTAEHDDGHMVGQLSMAAAAYAWPLPWLKMHGETRSAGMWAEGKREDLWPWPRNGSFKPESAGAVAGHEGRIRELVKAGALIAAEIDRLQRVVERPANTGDHHA